MSAIKLHLEQAERDAVDRFASSLKVSAEDIAYAALNRLMLACADAEVCRDITETREWRRHNLPLWSDSACSVHAYEGKADEEPTPCRRIEA
ncbi:hypothetical protein [Opitutus terrae]|uniref:Uncharacterized protein n=1 Tax=Opitutus terrae (strain DSM 11246 / JCM 15787 / PB90-1) TaxID=452637 RepID=B1ZVN5_OPITP|nr:hypothetical protein [Opitutus terrae]ACB74132.1 hypothetical protein Oter_0844 [Opitutus terrae PB90-1]